jgi:hypothetical protein
VWANKVCGLPGEFLLKACFRLCRKQGLKNFFQAFAFRKSCMGLSAMVRAVYVNSGKKDEGSMNIYVGNIAYSVTADDLREAFAEYGQVDSARVISDRATGRSKGFGFVEMSNDDEAGSAIEALNGQELGGREVVVNKARPREDNRRRSGGGGGGGGNFRRY